MNVLINDISQFSVFEINFILLIFADHFYTMYNGDYV